MYKDLKIFENRIINSDKATIKGTNIILKETGTGKVLFRGSNKVIVSGSEYNALKNFSFDNNEYLETEEFLSTIPSYDKAFSVFNSSNTIEKQSFDSISRWIPANTSSILSGNIFSSLRGEDIVTGTSDLAKLYRYLTRRVCCFCVGIDGCGIEASRVFKVSNTKWIAPYGYARYDDGTGKISQDISNCLIPFKYRTSATDLSSVNRAKYYGRYIVPDNGSDMVGYFFKGFDDTPKLIRRYSDDSAELSDIGDVWNDLRASEAEVVVQLKMTVSNTDCRDYFNKLTGINDSKVNCISLCTGIPVKATVNGIESLSFIDIRPFTRFNFPNESLIDASKGLDITYYLYY